MSSRPTRPTALRDLVLVIAATADRAIAAALTDADVHGHVARAALAVLAERTPFPQLQGALAADVAELLAWAEVAPAGVAVEALRCASDLAAARARPPLKLVGALALWRRELAEGTRQFGDSDACAAAARWETVALERDAAGDRAGALEALEQAGARALEIATRTPPVTTTPRHAPAPLRAA